SQVNEREVRSILRQLTVKLDDFQYNLDYELRQNSPANQTAEEDLRNSLDELQTGVNNFQNKFTRRRDSQTDVSQLLASADTVEENLSRLRVSQKLRREWTDTQGLLNQLANNYGVRGGDLSDNDDDSQQQQQQQQYPTRNQYPNQTPRTGNFNNGLTGTYQLDVSRSENAADVAERAITGANTQNREDARRDLREKLEAPERLAIEVRGNQITLASSLASRVTFTADGRDRTETLADGRTLRIRTALRGQELTIASLGGNNDYTVTFTSIENGRSLKVTRRVTTDYLNQTVFAESVYTKTDAVARFDINDSNTTTNPTTPNTNYPPTTTTGRTGEFIVPNGTIITGNLENDILTNVSQNGDRFRMTVSAPNQFRGAVIEGYLSGLARSGKVSGRSQVTLNFERIRMPNGETYDFAGYLMSVTDQDGKTVKVDTEGAVKSESQTKETAKRGGIGAGLGAIIGAIAGGGKGAAIGAIIGGGAGAGSVYAQGREDLELKAGSAVTVQASSPIR
ncbi:MAG: hypothetical protein M3384_14550, partial [Acidobacteriota bacterium]|nr:hypothetical protein [Acidobacteriota bacterium]